MAGGRQKAALGLVGALGFRPGSPEFIGQAPPVGDIANGGQDQEIRGRSLDTLQRAFPGVDRGDEKALQFQEFLQHGSEGDVVVHKQETGTHRRARVIHRTTALRLIVATGPETPIAALLLTVC